MNGWQENEDAVAEVRLTDTETGLPIDPAVSSARVTFTKPDHTLLDMELTENGGLWRGEVFFDQEGPWVPRLIVSGAYRSKRRLPTMHVSSD